MAAAGADHIPGQHEDDLHRQGQIVVDGVQALQVGVREHPAQQPLHLPGQPVKALLPLQGVGDIPAGVLRGAVVLHRGGLRGRGDTGATALSQPHGSEPGKGGAHAAGVPPQLGGGLVRVAPRLEQGQI